MSIAEIPAVGRDASELAKPGTPSNRCQRTDIMNGTFSSKPHFVRNTAPITPPTPAGTRIAAKMTPVATTLHFTHEDKARPSRERNAIQINAPAIRPTAMGRFAAAQGCGEE
jgi:hypothetical protein